jgi:hypothetical protein
MSALQLTNSYTSAINGVTTTTGYLKITRFNGNETVFNFFVSIWVSAASFTSGQRPFEGLNFTVPTTSVTSAASAYAYLQTLPQFSGSTLIS